MTLGPGESGWTLWRLPTGGDWTLARVLGDLEQADVETAGTHAVVVGIRSAQPDEDPAIVQTLLSGDEGVTWLVSSMQDENAGCEPRLALRAIQATLGCDYDDGYGLRYARIWFGP